MRKKMDFVYIFLLEREGGGRGGRGDGCVKLYIVNLQDLHHFRGTILEDERRHSSPYLHRLLIINSIHLAQGTCILVLKNASFFFIVFDPTSK